MRKVAAADVVIFGGGIAGLWLLSRLRAAGYSALLFESGTLGGGQTLKAQGIIHGGMKYALQGVLTNDAQVMADMPRRWKECLHGGGELDLKGVPVLSNKHYLWSPNKFTSKLTGFLASSALMSNVEPLLKENYPSVFQFPAFKGRVFALDEIVIDVPALMRALVKANQDAVYRIEPLSDEEIKLDENGKMQSATVYMAGKSVEVEAQQFVFVAGVGNEVIIKKLKLADLALQRRPLHQVMVKTPFAYPLYAHCLGLGARPRLTVTTHHLQDGKCVWYLGGQLAEDGVERDAKAQILAAREELHVLFPWLDFTGAEFSAFMVDRAEPWQANGMKPESTYARGIENMTIAWPIKLALAPKLADDIMQQLQKRGVTPQWFDTRELRSWPMPPVAKPVWEEAFCKKDA